LKQSFTRLSVFLFINPALVELSLFISSSMIRLDLIAAMEKDFPCRSRAANWRSTLKEIFTHIGILCLLGLYSQSGDHIDGAIGVYDYKKIEQLTN